MNWGDERYVRIYTRNTADLVGMGWEARAVLWELLRHCDRSGIVPLGKHGVRGLAALIHVPADVVERALQVLEVDGCVRVTDASVVVPNFYAAQEAPRSDAARKRDERERKREEALRAVTNRDVESRSADEGSRDESSTRLERDTGHEMSLRALPCRADPCSAVQGVQGEASAAAASSPAPAPSEIVVRESKPHRKPAKGTRGTRLPAGWRPSEAVLAWARKELIADPLGPLEEFRDFWTSASKNATKLDWDAVYRNRLRELLERGRLAIDERLADERPSTPEDSEPVVPMPAKVADAMKKFFAPRELTAKPASAEDGRDDDGKEDTDAA